MLRDFTLAVLFALGVMLAFNVGGLQQMLFNATLRNPLNIALTTFLREHAPAEILKLEQQVLVSLWLSLYALLAGVLVSLALGSHRALSGITFWTAYALTWTILLIREGMKWDELPWHSMIPFAIGDWCTVPIYAIGVALVRFGRGGRLPRCTLIDLMAATAAFAMLSLVAIAESEWIPPLVFFAISTAIACRLYLWTPNAAASDPTPPSGEAGPIELNEHSSPPED